jgi:hypothetical protein
MRYTLLKAFTGQERHSNGEVCTPILAYVLLDNNTGKIDIHLTNDANIRIRRHGATNCEVRERMIDGVMTPYIRMNDGTRMNEYVVSIL